MVGATIGASALASAVGFCPLGAKELRELLKLELEGKVRLRVSASVLVMFVFMYVCMYVFMCAVATSCCRTKNSH